MKKNALRRPYPKNGKNKFVSTLTCHISSTIQCYRTLKITGWCAKDSLSNG